MKRILIAVLVLGLSACSFGQRRPFGGRGGYGAESPTQPKDEGEKRILAVLNEARQMGETYANVPDSDGKLMRLLTEAIGAKHVVEIGTSTGLSGLWFSMALRSTGGKLTTFEIDPGRAAVAREHFKKAGVDRIVTIVEGDAHENVTRIKDPVDVVFIDADKEGYIDYLNKMLPLVRPGGLILAHNVDMSQEFVRKLSGDPALETVIYQMGSGLSVTMKKR